jgi:hypothetical protein
MAEGTVPSIEVLSLQIRSCAQTHGHLVTRGQTPAFIASMMMMFLMGNKEGCGWDEFGSFLLQRR